MLLPQQTTALLSGTLSYRETGLGDPLVFLHGLNGNSASWEKQFERLGDRFRVLAWDAPGYGQSSLQDPVVDRYAELAAAWLQERNAAPATIIGHSMGGVVAARLAINYPQLVRRLVLSCSQSGLGHSADDPLGSSYLARIDARTSLSDEEFGKFGAGRMLPENTSPEVFAAVAARASEVTTAGLRDAIRMIHTTDNLPGLAKITCPTLILDASDDPVVKPDRTAALVAAMPASSRVTLDGLGHAPYLENPEAYNRALTEFIQEN